MAKGTSVDEDAGRGGGSSAIIALASAGADVNKATTDGGVPTLFSASKAGHVDVVKVLVAADADVNKATTDGG